MDWMSPLITSGLRLVVISLLFIANCVAVCRLYVSQKYKVASCCKWITIFTILILNLIYLSTIWAPFTITTFEYNLQDLQQSSSHHVQENWPGKVVGETRFVPSNDWNIEEMQDMMNDGFYRTQYGHLENDISSAPQAVHSRLSDSLDHYITTLQDLVTSSYTYTLVLLTFVRKVPSKKQFVNIGRVRLSLLGLLYIVAPIGLSISYRGISGTTNHQFALHNSETPINGYTVFSIICDVNITVKYVIGVFMEAVMILLLGLVLMVVTHDALKRLHIPRKDKQERAESQQIDDVAYRFVLFLGSIWAWPVKPVFVVVLLYFNGEHWNSVVCWLANMVVAVPVVFMPLAVLISRDDEPDHEIGYNVLRDPENTQKVTEKTEPGIEVGSEAKDDKCSATGDRVDTSTVEKITEKNKNTAEKGTQARENLKFYLGTDIFKPKKEDEVCILSQQSLT